MIGSTSKRGLAAVLLMASAFAPAATARAAPAPAEKGARAAGSAARASSDAFVRTELFFGTDRADGTSVSDEEWQGFLDEEVTPRFPDGLTVLTGYGQFRTSEGVIEQERSFVLVLLYPAAARKDADAKIEEIRGLYKTRFAQESVLRVDDRRPARVSF